MDINNIKKYSSSERIVIGTKALGEVFGVDRKWIEDLTKRGILEKQGRGTYDLIKNVNLYIKHLKAKTIANDDAKSIEIEKAQEDMKLKKAKREKAELELKITKGDLVTTREVKQTYGDLVQTFRSKMLMLPVKVAPKVIGLKEMKSIQDLIQQEVYNSLTELSKLTTDDLEKGGGDNETS